MGFRGLGFRVPAIYPLSKESALRILEHQRDKQTENKVEYRGYMTVSPDIGAYYPNIN